MTPTTKQALEYVLNTAGGATRDNFVEDFAPIGEEIWDDLENAGYVNETDDGRIRLTDKGSAVLHDFT